MSLVVTDLYKKYGEKVVVDHLSFQMKEPGVYALLGTNGAGKTTSIRMMLGMLAKDGGETLWKGKPLSTDTCNVGYLAEERGLYPKYSLMDQLLYFASLRGVPRAEAKERIRFWAKRLEAEEYLYPEKAAGTKQEAGEGEGSRGKKGKLGAGSRRRQKPKLADQLSKGNQQKIQLMIALISDPELLILDEPLSGLDPVNTDLFKEVIREEIARGKYLIMSSHQMATVEEFCTDITILDRSRPVVQGNLNEIKKGYGRVNLHLKTEKDAAAWIAAAGAQVLSEKEREYQLKVTGEEQANRLLAMLIENQIPVITFDLREPSLHEIFVEKVGHSNGQI
ncbi:MAG: ATP-binding cassette domain-containing protein [Lachnospiraceae bacterium]|nr:ATP-binding cassette domain-containing protein [Lachnospiraceae bacterium]